MKVSKWGNNLAVRLPKWLVDQLGLRSGDELEIVAASPEGVAVATVDHRKAAIERMKARRWDMPPGYRFGRDEANQR